MTWLRIEPADQINNALDDFLAVEPEILLVLINSNILQPGRAAKIRLGRQYA